MPWGPGPRTTGLALTAFAFHPPWITNNFGRPGPTSATALRRSTKECSCSYCFPKRSKLVSQNETMHKTYYVVVLAVTQIHLQLCCMHLANVRRAGYEKSLKANMLSTSLNSLTSNCLISPLTGLRSGLVTQPLQLPNSLARTDSYFFIISTRDNNIEICPELKL
jgi:hypothetical protein